MRRNAEDLIVLSGADPGRHWVQPHGYVIQIEDRGIGMTDDEIARVNLRLADPPEVDGALSRVLGLYVVGRLGQHHGIKVQLRHSWYGGITALVLLEHQRLRWPSRAREGSEAPPSTGQAPKDDAPTPS